MSPKILELISVTPESTLVEHGVYVRPAASTSADSFGQGRVFVMGDAAHPMRPWGQGYAQAVEDAYALGLALGKGGSAGAIDLEGLQVSMYLLIGFPATFGVLTVGDSCNLSSAWGAHVASCQHECRQLWAGPHVCYG
jgi:hypothetical protein